MPIMRGALEGPGRVPISAEEAGGRARELLRGEEELGVHERLRGAGAVREGVDVVPELRGRGPRRAGVRPVRQLRRPEVPRGEDHARVPLPAAAQGAGAAHVPPHVRVPRRAEVPRDRQGRQGLRARGRPTRAQARGGRHQGHRGARPRPVRQLRAAAHHPGEQRVQQEDHGVHQGELLRVLHPQVRQQRGGDRHQGGRR